MLRNKISYDTSENSILKEWIAIYVWSICLWYIKIQKQKKKRKLIFGMLRWYWGCKHSREFKLLKWNHGKRSEWKKWQVNKSGIMAALLFAICSYYLNKQESRAVLDEIKFRYYSVVVCWHTTNIIVAMVWFK